MAVHVYRISFLTESLSSCFCSPTVVISTDGSSFSVPEAESYSSSELMLQKYSGISNWKRYPFVFCHGFQVVVVKLVVVVHIVVIINNIVIDNETMIL